MTVAVDTDKFSKILSNLISNALKYTPEEGHITVSLTLADTLPEKLTAAASSHYLVVSVTDDGTGMSQEDVERIFERYKRLTAGEHVAAGSGIGLHYVKQLLLIHKGSIVELADAEELVAHAIHPYTRSLLSAIPMPDPRRERNKKLLVYDPAMHDYSTEAPQWRELRPRHWVLCSAAEAAQWLPQA